MKQLEGKLALVTGASKGIGRAVALRLAQGGAKVIINYHTDDAAAEETAALIAKIGGTAVLHKADVADIEAVKTMMETTAKEHGGVDILVNNASALLDKPFTEVADGELEGLFNSNINGVFNCVKFAAKGMIKKRYGKIINIASASAFQADPCMGAYSASKGAVVSMTKSMAKELGSRNVRVNCVAPGLIDTDMIKGYAQETIDAVLSKAVIKNVGAPEDVANAVYFLATPESDYITGQTIHVNGGIRM